MSYTLGSTTLPRPKKVTRKFVETGAENLLIEGTSTKRVENRKEIFILEFQHLTRSQVNSILYEYELNQVRTFTVDEGNLSIGPTDVLINIGDRDYPSSGKLYRENFQIVLTEVI